MIHVSKNLDSELIRRVAEFTASAPLLMGGFGEHDLRWLTVLRQGLGHGPYLLTAEDAEGRLTGFLPLALVRSVLFGKYLVSLPYLNRAGVCAVDAATATSLIDRACALADELDVRYLELRHGNPIDHPRLTVRRDEKQRMVMDLPDDPEKLMKLYDAKLRNLIRKGEKSAFELIWGGTDVAGDFYDVFAVNMRDLGTPVYSPALFAAIVRETGGKGELAVVKYQGHAVAGALLVHDAPTPVQPATTQVPSASCLRAYNHTNANMWMYHQLLQRAISKGSRQFDFGRSSLDSGTYKFKKQWGARPQTTVWQYYVRQGEVNAVRPDNPKYRRRIEMWQRLPVWLTRLVGPSIVRGIP